MAQPGEKRTILVVDDTPTNIQMVNAMLKETYKIRIATNGPKALELAVANPPPDLILLDVMMPDMDGYEVCTRLKADVATRDIPVIFLTARTDAEDETRGFELGAIDYIHKPFSPTVVHARLHTHLALREARDQLALEKQRADRLLDSLLPPAAVVEIKASGRVEPRQFDNVAVLFCDLVGFTGYCAQHGPTQVVEALEAIFLLFEECARRHGLEKIKTIGDAFLATAGLLQPASDPLATAVACALDISDVLEKQGWPCHSGVHIGPLTAGIVGRERFQFDIWGDTVNVAARLCDAASVGRVAVLEHQAAALAGAELNPRGEVVLKGKGAVRVVEVTRLPALTA